MRPSNASRSNDFYASVRPLFQRFFEQANVFAFRACNANERSNALIKSLYLLNLERRFVLTTPDFDWRRRVEAALASVQNEIAAVESRAERAYLRRLTLDAALALNACDETFFVEPTTDALLTEIDDAEERQNALVAYSTRLADRVFRFQKSDAPERVKAFALIEEIEDLRLFERAAANVVAAVIFDAVRRPSVSNARSEIKIPLVASPEPLDLTPFGDDVADAWEQFESPGGFLELCERASAEFFSPLRDEPPTAQEIALRQALNAETRRRLEALLTALDSGVEASSPTAGTTDASTAPSTDVADSPLDEEELAELQSVVDEAVIASPFALQNGEFFRAFLERARNLDAFVPIFERFSEAEAETKTEKTRRPSAENATPTQSNDAEIDVAESPANTCRYSFYDASFKNLDAEKTRWLESARRVAARSLTFDANLRVKLNRLTTSAELEFRFGDKSQGKNAVRELLGLLPRLESPFERAQLYRRLVTAHLSASYPKAAQKLATLWKAELDAIEPEDLRDAALADAFEVYSQAVKHDATSLSTFIESISAPLVRFDAKTRQQLDAVFSFDDTTSLTNDAIAAHLVARLANLVDASVAFLETLDETSPDEAVFALVKIATAVADRFANTPTSR